MRILFDLGHPAHFHLFRCAIAELRKAAHEVVIFARDKDCLPRLLDATGWPYQVFPRRTPGLAGVAARELRVLARLVSLAGRKPFDLMVGTSVVVGPAARLTGATSLVFNEDDAAVVPIFTSLAYGPAHYIVTPQCLARENYGTKHLTYPGYHELAYLHPDRFRPDPGIRALLGVRPEERYFLVRLVALRAHHDVGQKGLGPQQAREVVRRLARHGQVFVSREDPTVELFGATLLPTPPERIFDVMAFADLLVGDSQTMTIEAAVLGTPAVRCNTFVGRITYLKELEGRYGLAAGVRPEDFHSLLELLDAWLAAPDLKEQWRRRRDAMLTRCVDLTTWMLEVFRRLADKRAARRLSAGDDHAKGDWGARAARKPCGPGRPRNGGPGTGLHE